MERLVSLSSSPNLCLIPALRIYNLDCPVYALMSLPFIPIAYRQQMSISSSSSPYECSLRRNSGQLSSMVILVDRMNDARSEIRLSNFSLAFLISEFLEVRCDTTIELRISNLLKIISFVSGEMATFSSIRDNTSFSASASAYSCSNFIISISISFFSMVLIFSFLMIRKMIVMAHSNPIILISAVRSFLCRASFSSISFLYLSSMNRTFDE